MFDRLVVLSGADVRSDVAFQGAVFRDGLFLRTFGRPPVIRGTTNLTLATMSLVRADQAIFQGPVDARGARFLGDASFFETDFEDLAFFDQASFSGDAVFSGVPRAGNAPGIAAAGSCVRTAGAFAGSATFVRTIFSRIADFRQRCFQERASFQDAVFGGGADAFDQPHAGQRGAQRLCRLSATDHSDVHAPPPGRSRPPTSPSGR